MFTFLQPQDAVLMGRPKKFISEDPKPVTIGTTKFRPITSLQRKLIDKNRKYWTNDREWPIDYGKFDKFSWKETLQIIEEAGIDNLWLNDNNSNVVLKSLVPCKFSNLLILNLNTNTITNLQAICLINAPNLERIQLSDNQLVDIRSLRKTSFPNLTWLTLCNNPITNWAVMSDLYAPKLQRLQFMRKPFPLLNEGISWLLKMESDCLNRVDALAFTRIPQQAARSAINEKYKGIKLEWSIM